MLYAYLIGKLIMTSFYPVAWESPVRNFFSIKTEATRFLLLYILKHSDVLALSQK